MIHGQRLSYWFVYACMHILALLPFRALYVLSDCLYVLLRYIVCYRKKVVRTNLHNSFPEKSKRELREIERKFYHYICDYIVTEVKLARITAQDIIERMSYDNFDVFSDRIEEGRGIALLIRMGILRLTI